MRKTRNPELTGSLCARASSVVKGAPHARTGDSLPPPRLGGGVSAPHARTGDSDKDTALATKAECTPCTYGGFEEAPHEAGIYPCAAHARTGDSLHEPIIDHKVWCTPCTYGGFCSSTRYTLDTNVRPIRLQGIRSGPRHKQKEVVHPMPVPIRGEGFPSD